MAREKIIIGLTGPMAAGHGVIADYLKKKGFLFSSTSDRIREECQRRNLEITRENLQKLGDELRCQFGPEVLAKRTWEKIQKYSLSVIDSIRSLAEVEFLKTKPNFYLFGVTASQKSRYQRLAARNRESDPITWKAFLAADKKDFKSGQGKLGRNINACLKKADFVLYNNQTIKDLEKKVEQYLEKIQNK